MTARELVADLRARTRDLDDLTNRVPDLKTRPLVAVYQWAESLLSTLPAGGLMPATSAGRVVAEGAEAVREAVQRLQDRIRYTVFERVRTRVELELEGRSLAEGNR